MKFHKTKIVVGRLCKNGFLISIFVFVLTVTSASSQPPSCADDSEIGTQREVVVRQFVEAFNAHDTKRMLEMVDENIQWVSVDGTTASIEANGLPALKKSMDSYFARCSSCKSTLEWVQSGLDKVTTLERAEWTGKNGPKSQKGLAVYEFRGDKILRVYYFPVEVDKNY